MAHLARRASLFARPLGSLAKPHEQAGTAGLLRPGQAHADKAQVVHDVPDPPSHRVSQSIRIAEEKRALLAGQARARDQSDAPPGKQSEAQGAAGLRGGPDAAHPLQPGARETSIKNGLARLPSLGGPAAAKTLAEGCIPALPTDSAEAVPEILEPKGEAGFQRGEKSHRPSHPAHGEGMDWS